MKITLKLSEDKTQYTIYKNRSIVAGGTCESEEYAIAKLNEYKTDLNKDDKNKN